MAKDRELQDHERAHSGVAGSKVDHGPVSDSPQFMTKLVKGLNPDYGYRRVHALINTQGLNVSQRQVRKHMGIGRENQQDD